MNKIVLNVQAVERLYKLFNKLNKSKDFDIVTLETEDKNGIGNVITATFYVIHNEIEGEFRVTIADENDW